MSPRALQQVRFEEHGLVVGCFSNDCDRAVHGKELRSEGPSRETAVPSVLGSPCGYLVQEVEAESGLGVTDQIVDGAETVKRTAQLATE
jgi:hypothetical protein